jgi:hypothetical protein
MKAVKNMRDPLSHPSASDFSFEDAFATLDPARRILLRLQLSEAADSVKAWMDELAGLSIAIESVAEPLEDRLPAKETIIVDFVGREKELLELDMWFNDPTTRRWALTGEGGKGKSAIAYRFATKIKFTAPPAFQIVLWISAKCLVPELDGAYFSDVQKEALWDKFFTGAPARQRQSAERYNIVKRA